MINIADCVNKDTIKYNKLILKRKQKEIVKLDKDIIKAGIKEEKAKTKYDIALTIEKQSKAEKKLRALEIARIKKEYKEKNIENPFTISLYSEKKTTLKEKYLIKQYQQLQGYFKKYVIDIEKTNFNGNVDLLGQEVKGREFLKLDNIEAYITNTELKRLEQLENGIIPISTSKQQKKRIKENFKGIENKRIINKGKVFNMHGISTATPLDIIENKYNSDIYTQKVKENSSLIIEYKKTNKKIEKQLKENNRQSKIYNKRKALKQEIINRIFC